MTGKGIGRIPLDRVEEIDAKKRSDPHDDGEAFVHRDGLGDLVGEIIIAFLPQPKQLEDKDEDRSSTRTHGACGHVSIRVRGSDADGKGDAEPAVGAAHDRPGGPGYGFDGE